MFKACQWFGFFFPKCNLSIKMTHHDIPSKEAASFLQMLKHIKCNAVNCTD